jgi:hypothetical protein
VTEVDGVAVSSKSLHEVQAMLRGEPGSNICVSFERSAPNNLAYVYVTCTNADDTVCMPACICAGTFHLQIRVY